MRAISKQRPKTRRGAVAAHTKPQIYPQNPSLSLVLTFSLKSDQCNCCLLTMKAEIKEFTIKATVCQQRADKMVYP